LAKTHQEELAGKKILNNRNKPNQPESADARERFRERAGTEGPLEEAPGSPTTMTNIKDICEETSGIACREKKY
jgi:hypothetical protein